MSSDDDDAVLLLSTDAPAEHDVNVPGLADHSIPYADPMVVLEPPATMDASESQSSATDAMGGESLQEQQGVGAIIMSDQGASTAEETGGEAPATVEAGSEAPTAQETVDMTGGGRGEAPATGEASSMAPATQDDPAMVTEDLTAGDWQ